MEWWAWVLIGTAAALLLLAVAALALLRWLGSPERSPTIRRLLALPLRKKLSLFPRLVRDPRVPLRVKALLPALILYLALPVDLIPDFIPVAGHLDDLLAVALVAFLLVKATPAGAIEEHLEALEREQGEESGGRA